MTISSWLNFGRPAPPERVCGEANFFGSALLQPARSVCVSSKRFFHLKYEKYLDYCPTFVTFQKWCQMSGSNLSSRTLTLIIFTTFPHFSNHTEPVRILSSLRCQRIHIHQWIPFCIKTYSCCWKLSAHYWWPRLTANVLPALSDVWTHPCVQSLWPMALIHTIDMETNLDCVVDIFVTLHPTKLELDSLLK